MPVPTTKPRRYDSPVRAERAIGFIHPDDRHSTAQESHSQVTTGTSINFENRLLCKDGSWRWVSWHSSFDERSGLGFGTARDITDYKRMVEDINKKEETYRALAVTFTASVRRSTSSQSMLPRKASMYFGRSLGA